MQVALAAVLAAIASNSFAQSNNFIKNNPDGSQTLTGHVPANTAYAKLLYHAYSSQVLNLQVELPLNNQAQLTSLLQDLYNPKSPSFHQWLTPQQFAQNFGYNGNETSALQIKEYMRSQGLALTGQSPNGLVLYVSGPVPAVEHAFATQINYYQKNDGTVFFSPAVDPTIPPALAGKILAVGGLDNLPKFQKHFIKQLQPVQHAVGSGPGGFLAPSDVKTAYNLSPIASTGTGQTQAVFELDGYNASDIAKYDSQFGLTYSGTLTTVLIDGFSGKPNFSSTGGADEVELDIELMTAFAPAANILVYEAPNTSISWMDEWTRIASDNKAKTISCSWGEPEVDSPTLNFDYSTFQEMAAQGQAVFVASGDNGAYDAGGKVLGVDEPSSQPYVTGTGISKLTFGAKQSYGSESASVYGGGGISQFFAIPTYQTTLAAQASKAALASTTMRNVPDVVLTADAATGYAFYINGVWGGYYGSSIAAPVWASFTSLVNQGLGQNGPLGFANNSLYSLANDFHDITTGNNGYYPAGPGFDDATGLGSFNGLNLYDDLVKVTAPANPPAAPANLTAAAGNASVALSWTGSAGALSYTVLRSTVNNGPYTSIAKLVISTSYTDTTAANGTPYYYVVRAVNGAGSSGNSNQAGATPVAPVLLPPANLTAASSAYRGSRAILLQWDLSTSPNVLYYLVYRSTGSAAPSLYGYVASTTTGVYDTGVRHGNKYNYYLTTYTTGGTQSGPSNEVSLNF